MEKKILLTTFLKGKTTKEGAVLMFRVDSVYELTKSALGATSLRQEVISNNIANVNTKDYKAKQVIFETELEKALSSSASVMKATDSRHFGVGRDLSSITARVVEDKESQKMNVDGNSIDIDLEMANMAANQIQYNTLIQSANSRLQDYHSVIKG